MYFLERFRYFGKQFDESPDQHQLAKMLADAKVRGSVFSANFGFWIRDFGLIVLVFS
jgi:hypothetical protein